MPIGAVLCNIKINTAKMTLILCEKYSCYQGGDGGEGRWDKALALRGIWGKALAAKCCCRESEADDMLRYALRSYIPKIM